MLYAWGIIESFLYAAKKYGMPGPASIVCAIMCTEPFLDKPLRLYATACHYGWDAEARLASSLKLDLYAPDQRATLLKLKMPSYWRCTTCTTHGASTSSCTSTNAVPHRHADGRRVRTLHALRRPVDYAARRELKYEMDRWPQGDTITSGVEWLLAEACWQAKCKKQICGRAVYDKAPSTKVIKEALASRPSSIVGSLPFHHVVPPAEPLSMQQVTLE